MITCHPSIQRLEEIHVNEEPFLPINCSHIQQFDEDLYRWLARTLLLCFCYFCYYSCFNPTLFRQLVCYPQEVIPALDMAVNEVFFQK